MTLFIACLLIYGMELPPWMYAVALGVWIVSIKFQMVLDGWVVKNSR